METLNLQTLVSGTAQALMEASASDYYQRVFKTLGRQLLAYADIHETDGFSMDFGLQFLEDHYHMSEKIAAKKWPIIYSRCINFISDYQRTGHIVLCFGVIKKVYIIPEGFQKSTSEYLDYRKKIGISDKTNRLSLLYLERFFDFLDGEEIHSPSGITIRHVHLFLKYIGTMEKSSICANMRAVRYYLKYCYENSYMADGLFSKIPNVYYNRQSRLPSSYTTARALTCCPRISHCRAYNSTANDVTEQVIKGNIALIKHTDNGETQIETPEVGAEFSVYLKSAGSYDAAKDTERDYLVCDENGYAATKDLPYGIYTVHQVKGWDGRELLSDFDVYIAKNGQTYRYLANNANFESYIKIVKVDAETGKVIPYAGAGFQLYRPDGSLITQTFTYPEVTTIDTFYTNDEGTLITPEKLEYGSGYSLVEVFAPYGYTLNSEPVYFDVTQDASTDEDGVTVIEVIFQRTYRLYFVSEKGRSTKLNISA